MLHDKYTNLFCDCKTFPDTATAAMNLQIQNDTKTFFRLFSWIAQSKIVEKYCTTFQKNAYSSEATC